MISDTDNSDIVDYSYHIVIFSLGLEKKHRDVLNKIRLKKKTFRFGMSSVVKSLLEMYDMLPIDSNEYHAVKIVLRDIIDKTSERLRVKILTTLVLHDL